VVRRHELTDQAWAELAPLLPGNGRPGGQWADHRTVVNGILWKLATGVPWRDLPERYGPWQTCYERFRRWQADGTWDRLVAQAQTKSDAVGEIDWDVSVDATIVRAHQHAAGARKTGTPKGDQGPTRPAGQTGRQPGARAQPRRTLDQDSSRGRRARSAAGHAGHTRAAAREHPAWAAAGHDPGPAARWAGSAPQAADPSDR
jgi:transposase